MLTRTTPAAILDNPVNTRSLTCSPVTGSVWLTAWIGGPLGDGLTLRLGLLLGFLLGFLLGLLLGLLAGLWLRDVPGDGE